MADLGEEGDDALPFLRRRAEITDQGMEMLDGGGKNLGQRLLPGAGKALTNMSAEFLSLKLGAGFACRMLSLPDDGLA